MTEMTREIATKVRDVVDAGLVAGQGEPVPGQMCVEAAVCFALGLPHGDDPGCVAQSLRALKIQLNDAAWPSDQARAKGLRRLAIAQLGSAGVLNEPDFIRRVVEMTIRRMLPVALRAAASRNPAHARALEAAAVRCAQEGTRESALHGERVARSAASAAYAAASAAAFAAAFAAFAAAGSAAFAAGFAAGFAAASAADAAAAVSARTRDRVLADYAESVVEILIDLKAPGCAFLDLVPVAV